MDNKDESRSKNEVEAAAESLELHEPLADDVETILDEIDEVLEEDAEEFVRSYVIKGGQGWSGVFTPEFYVGAATAGVLGGATYDIFKTVIRRIAKALLQIPGRSGVTEAAVWEEEEDTILYQAWKTANRLAKQQDIQHSIDEATALHWTLFITQLGRSLGLVHLGIGRYRKLVSASASSEEYSDPSQLAAQIIDQWLEQRELHTRLRKAREAAGLTREAVAEQLECSLSKVIRIEAGIVRIATRDLTTLLHLYGIGSPRIINEFARYRKLVSPSASSEEYSDPSQLAAQIIDQWLEQRELHTRLRKAREAAGLTREAVAEQLDWSVSKVIRIEAGIVRIATRDLTTLLHLYGIESQRIINEFKALSKTRRQLSQQRIRERHGT